MTIERRGTEMLEIAEGSALSGERLADDTNRLTGDRDIATADWQAHAASVRTLAIRLMETPAADAGGAGDYRLSLKGLRQTRPGKRKEARHLLAPI